MIRLRNAILAAVASLFAAGALAQVGFSQDSERAYAAEELFGSGSVKLEFNPMGTDMDPDDRWEPKAKLIFEGATEIAANTEFTVTMTLSNATFAEPVSNSDFMWGTWGPNQAQDDLEFVADTANEVTLERHGGAKGDNSVSFTVTVPSLIDNLQTPAESGGTYSGATRKIVFAVPDLNASGLRARNDAGKGGNQVRVMTTIEQTKSGGTAIMEGIVNGNVCGDYDMVETGSVSCPVVEAKKVVPTIGNTGGGGYISLVPADERAVLVEKDGKARKNQLLELSTITVDAVLSGVARDQDGDKIESLTGDLAGSLAIKVESDNFNDGDVVFIDSDSDGKVGGREAFDMEDGVASDTVALDNKSHKILYVPSGDAPMKHRTEFKVSANTEFADTDALMRSATPMTATLMLQGIEGAPAQAYAIAPVDHADISNVRVTCETAAKSGCTVFLDCKDQDGMKSFGEAGAMVGPNATVRWSQAEVATALGMDDGWSGRLACDVLSTAKVSVQVLTRSGNVLVNNTPISTGGSN